jgi:salicylate hydroxylase
VRLPLGAAILARHGAPYWVVRRADLQHVLLAAATAEPLISLSYDWRLDKLAEKSTGGVVASSADGRQLRGLALIGADGIWSRVRQILPNDVPPRAAGKAAWRMQLDLSAGKAPVNTAEVCGWLGPDAHVVHYPVAAGRSLNVVVIVADARSEREWDLAADGAELHARFARWPEPVRELLRSAPSWRRWSLYERPEPLRWNQGPVLLIGDAVHPVLPFLAQGAGLAIEDAQVAALSLAQSPDNPASAWQRVALARNDRCVRVRDHAQRNGNIYHLRGVPAFARDSYLAWRGGSRLITDLDWLYAYKNSGHAV